MTEGQAPPTLPTKSKTDGKGKVMKGLVFHVMGLELYLVSKTESLKGSKERKMTCSNLNL